MNVRVLLPYHLRNLAGVEGEVVVSLQGEGGAAASTAPTIADLLDALESRFPVLEGTIRDHGGGPRRAYLRFFACGEDLSHEGEGHPLPGQVVEGTEVFRVVGAISGGRDAGTRSTRGDAVDPWGLDRSSRLRYGASSASSSSVGIRWPTQKLPNSA